MLSIFIFFYLFFLKLRRTAPVSTCQINHVCINSNHINKEIQSHRPRSSFSYLNSFRHLAIRKKNRTYPNRQISSKTPLSLLANLRGDLAGNKPYCHVLCPKPLWTRGAHYSFTSLQKECCLETACSFSSISCPFPWATVMDSCWKNTDECERGGVGRSIKGNLWYRHFLFVSAFLAERHSSSNTCNSYCTSTKWQTVKLGSCGISGMSLFNLLFCGLTMSILSVVKILKT